MNALVEFLTSKYGNLPLSSVMEKRICDIFDGFSEFEKKLIAKNKSKEQAAQNSNTENNCPNFNALYNGAIIWNEDVAVDNLPYGLVLRRGNTVVMNTRTGAVTVSRGDIPGELRTDVYGKNPHRLNRNFYSWPGTLLDVDLYMILEDAAKPDHFNPAGNT